jgi:hypothetical protein
MKARVLSGLVAVAIAAGVFGLAAAAEPVKPRFTIDSSRDGFVRLDTLTGAVAHCSSLKGEWICDSILSADAGLGPRLDALANQVARLAAETTALDARIGLLAKGEASAPVSMLPQPATTQPAARPSAGVSFADRIVERFLAMVRLLKHGKGEVLPAARAS